jgi:hypothetical protein
MNDRASTVVESDGIRVEKSFTRDDFPVPAVTFELTSARDTAVTVRLVDTIPEAIGMEAIGFHPAYGSEHWTAYSDHRVEFERTLAPDEAVETVYGVRVDDPDPTVFLTEPTVDTASRDAEIEDVLGPDGAARVREALSTGQKGLEPLEADTADTQSAPDLESDDSAETTSSEAAPSGTAAEADSTAESTTSPRPWRSQTTSVITRREPQTTADAAESDDDETDPAVSVSTTAETGAPKRDATVRGSTASEDAVTVDVAAELAAAIRRGEVEQSDLETLRSALDTGPPPSVDVRLDRLHARVGEFDAYTDALSTLIDEEGPAEAVFARLEALEGAVESVETRLDAVERAHAALASDVPTGSDRLTDVADRLDTEVAALEDHTDEELAALRTDIDALEDQLSEFETFRRRLNEALDP